VPAGTAEDATGKNTAISQAGESRLTRLESLRALGSIAVLLTHTLALSLAGAPLEESYKNRLIYGNGVLGLYLFFVMSGYLLYLPFARRHLRAGRKINLRRYARNRLLRVVPVYYTAIAVLIILVPHGVDRADWWRWVTFTQNFSTDSLHLLNAPVWSVAVEMQFYLVLPVVAWAIGRISGPSFRRTVGILAGLALVSWFMRTRGVVPGTDPGGSQTGLFGNYALPAYLYAFAAGMLLAVARLAWERRPPRWAGWPVLGASGAWLAGAAVLQIIGCTDFAIHEYLLAFIATIVIGACVLPLRDGKLVSVLEWRPLAALGVASLSLYLWHWPILQEISGVHVQGLPEGSIRVEGDVYDFKRLLIYGLPPSIAAGLFSYWLIERPFLRRRLGWGGTAAAAPTAPVDASSPPEAATAPPRSG